MKKKLKIISLGAGVQSSAMYMMSCKGDMERADVAIFADTGDEPEYVYDYLGYLMNVGSIDIKIVTAGVLSERLFSGERCPSIPFFTEGGGMLWRQCTVEHKIAPIKRLVRKITKTTEMFIGISTEESTRMKTSRVKYITNRWPLIEKNISREGCLEYLRKNNLELPEKSACYYCPYRSNGAWLDMKKHHADEFARAVEFDGRLRTDYKGKITNKMYLHRSCKPLGEVNFGEDQLNMFENECEGYCGV